MAELKSSARRAPAVYLRHLESIAQFDPVALAAKLPVALSRDPYEVRMAYLHEHVHFIQSVSTFFGLARMHSAWRGFRNLQTALRSAAGHLALADFTEFKRMRDETLDGFAALSKDDPVHGHPGPGLKVKGHFEGLIRFPRTELSDEFVGFCVPGADEDWSWVHAVGTIALQEGMAFAVECLVDEERTRSTFEYAKSDHQNGGFDYVAVHLALADVLPDAAPSLIHGLVVVTTDVALGTMSPSLAWRACIEWLEAVKAVPSELDVPWLLSVHAELTKVSEPFRDPQASTQWLDDVRRARDREKGRPLAAYLELFVGADAIRSRQPRAFVELLLTMKRSQSEDMQPYHGLPFYDASEDLVTSRPSDDLAVAGLMMICLQHFASAVAAAPSSHELKAACPFIDSPSLCQMDRGVHCSEVPWYAPIVETLSGDETCIYRAATDFLGVKRA